MSFRKRPRDDDDDNRGNGRRRNNAQGEYTHQRRGPSIAVIEERFRDDLFKIPSLRGLDFLSGVIADEFARDPAFVLENFRIAITQQPMKTYIYASVVLDLMHVRSDDSDTIGAILIRDTLQAVQQFLDAQKWLAARQSVLFLAELASATEAPLSADALVALLASFLDLLNDPDIPLERGDAVARLVGEALLRLRGVDTDALVTRLSAYAESRAARLPWLAIDDASRAPQYFDYVPELIAALQLKSGVTILPRAEAPAVPPASAADVADGASAEEGAPAQEATSAARAGLIPIPPITIPPAPAESLHYLTHVDVRLSSAGLTGFEGVGYGGVRANIRVFYDAVASCLVGTSADAVILYSLVEDILNIYEINRREAALNLLDLPLYLVDGAFSDYEGVRVDARPAPPPEVPDTERDRDGDLDIALDRTEPPGWNLESVIIELLFAEMLAYPKPKFNPVYYQSLVTELCRLSPKTVAPALGRAVKLLYAGLPLGAAKGDEGGEAAEEYDSPAPLTSLDCENTRRFAEWFAVHLSNFGFNWAWNDWLPDMQASMDDAPSGVENVKRAFVTRVLELESRLSYYERIKSTVPEAFLDAGVMAKEAPAPTLLYSAPGHDKGAKAQAVLDLVKGKADRERILEELVDEDDESLAILVECILSVGSRSFSHFLNVLERYLALLKSLTTSSQKRRTLLSTVAHFWQNNHEFYVIVINKLVQYRLVDVIDVIEDILSSTTVDGFTLLDIVHSIVSTLDSRLEHCKKRLAQVTKVADDARVTNGALVGSEGDADKASPDHDANVAAAQEHLDTVKKEIEDVVVYIIQSFAKAEGTNPYAASPYWNFGSFREMIRSVISLKVLSSEGVKSKVDGLEFPQEFKDLVQAGIAWDETV